MVNAIVLENEEERSQILKQDIPAAYKAVLKKKPEQETQDRVSIQVQASGIKFLV